MAAFYATKLLVQIPWLAMLIWAVWQLGRDRSLSAILQAIGLFLFVGWLAVDNVCYDPYFGLFVDNNPSENWTQWWITVQQWLTAMFLICFATGYCLRPRTERAEGKG
jgi:hypothetical protein